MTFEINKDIHTKYEYELIGLEPENIGLFIGKNGVNFNSIINNIKHDIKKIDILEDIPLEVWNSIDIRLKITKKTDKVIAQIGCKKDEYDIIKNVIDEHLVYYKNLRNRYNFREQEHRKIVYRVGAPKNRISTLIGINGCNINYLKANITNIEGINKVINIKIEEQKYKLPEPFRNIGDIFSDEHIIIVIYFVGSCDFDEIKEVLEKYLEKHIKDYKKSIKKETQETNQNDEENDFWSF